MNVKIRIKTDIFRMKVLAVVKKVIPLHPLSGQKQRPRAQKKEFFEKDYIRK